MAKTVYRHNTLIFNILEKEDIKQIEVLKKMRDIVNFVNSQVKDNEQIKVVNKGDFSSIVSGRRWRLSEITAKKILKAINDLRKQRGRKDSLGILEVFEEERLRFYIKK